MLTGASQFGTSCCEMKNVFGSTTLAKMPKTGEPPQGRSSTTDPGEAQKGPRSWLLSPGSRLFVYDLGLFWASPGSVADGRPCGGSPVFGVFARVVDPKTFLFGAMFFRKCL